MKRCRFLLILSVFAGLALHAGAADFWGTRGLKIVQQTELEYPQALLLEGVKEAKATAIINVDADGKLVDCLITGYSHREVVPEILRGLNAWTFEPAIDRGRPVGTRLEVAFTFNAKGSVMSLNSNSMLAASFGGLFGLNMTSLVSKASDLDQPLAATHVVQPRHPGKIAPSGDAGGAVTIDFYVDADGRPRMPVVTRAAHEAMALAAVSALNEWRFAPPTAGGRPTAVRVVQQFIFDRS